VKTYTADEIARQRDRIVEAALQRARCIKLRMVIDEDGHIVQLPETTAASHARSYADNIDVEAEMLLVMLSTTWPANEGAA